jgi:REP element-mobilizing transposase RayT
MVIAHHLIWTAYGWWLPNDPRGSGSRVIRNDIIAELGELHYGRKKMQPAARDVRHFYEQARQVLRHPLLRFEADCRELIAAAFADVIKQKQYTCYACAIMPDHIHILIRKHKNLAEEMIEHFKQFSRQKLISTKSPHYQSSHLDRRGWLESFPRSSRGSETHHRLH